MSSPALPPPARRRIGDPVRVGLWTTAFTLLLAVLLLQLDVPSRVAYAVEKGKLEAERAELSEVEAISRAYRMVVSTARPSVVFIKVEKRLDGNAERLLREYFRNRPNATPPKYRPYGNGSGVIIDRSGLIVTNNHVVEDADRVVVGLDDGRSFPARILGRDPKTDLAVLKIDADQLHPLPLGDSSKLEVGDRVLAIGNPFNLKFTVTEGIVSALGRYNVGILGDGGYEDFIQTDAAINPGNSGGALVNMRGELVGINTAIATETGSYNGIAFAIPSNLVKQVSDKLKTGKPLQRGWLGVSIVDPTRETYEVLQQAGEDWFVKLPAGQREAWKKGELKGVLVMAALAGTPAEKAGLKVGDLVVEVAGRPTTDVTALRQYIAAQDPGTEVKLTVDRSGKRQVLTVTLGKQPDDVRAARRSPASSQATPDGATRASDLGLTIEALPADLAKKLKLKDGGVLVSAVQPGSAADELGVAKGDVIESVNGQPAATPKAFTELLREADLSAAGVVLYVRTPGGPGRYVLLQGE